MLRHPSALIQLALILSLYVFYVHGKSYGKQREENNYYEEQELTKPAVSGGTGNKNFDQERGQPRFPSNEREQSGKLRNSKYDKYGGNERDEEDNEDLSFTGSNKNKENEWRNNGAEWRNKDYITVKTTTTTKPTTYATSSKGGYNSNKSWADEEVVTTTTKKPWYVRFKNWTGKKFEQVSDKVRGRSDSDFDY